MISLDLSELEKWLGQMEMEVTDAEAHAIGGVLRQDVKEQFSRGGDPSWQPLSRITVARKRMLGYPRITRKGMNPESLKQNGILGPENILIMTGALLSSWTDETDPHHLEEHDGGNVWIGSLLPYAEIHQFGGWTVIDDRRVYVPARPLRVTEDARRRIIDLLDKATTK
ncbi:hypothetical protein EON81_13710 [bacterium]|nr:MAG: hypothetical protein EON81_13710 [bacterium]